MKYEVDAAGRSIGRVATEVASLLMGKNKPKYERHKISGHKVKIINTSKAKIGLRKLKTKTYKSYSGYPGGLKKELLENILERKGHGEVFRKAVYGMLPNNKLRPLIMKNLSISD